MALTYLGCVNSHIFAFFFWGGGGGGVYTFFTSAGPIHF